MLSRALFFMYSSTQNTWALISAGTYSYYNNKKRLIKCEGLFKYCISLVLDGIALYSLPIHCMAIKKKKSPFFGFRSFLLKSPSLCCYHRPFYCIFHVSFRG